MIVRAQREATTDSIQLEERNVFRENKRVYAWERNSREDGEEEE